MFYFDLFNILLNLNADPGKNQVFKVIKEELNEVRQVKKTP